MYVGILTLFQTASQPKTKATGLVRHQNVFFLLGVSCMTCGALAVFIKKWIHDKLHFVTLHGAMFSPPCICPF